jgi:prepilin-type N-terminal cleavage/methylation domain-containing protein
VNSLQPILGAQKRGFTLIELLVVIAIIGILASVILVSVGTARTKGIDAKIKTDVDSARAQSEIYYSANAESYAGLCTADAPDGTPGVKNMVSGAASIDAGTVVCTDTSSHAGTEGWALSAQLMTDTSQYWCADSSGTSTLRSSQIAATDVGC